jgi:integrase
MSKRGHGEGTLYQRKDGRWEASLQVNGVRRKVYGKNEREARAKLQDLQRMAITEGSLPDPGRRTVNDLLTMWLDSAPDLKPSTISKYRWFLDTCVRPALGDIRLEKVFLIK